MTRIVRVVMIRLPLVAILLVGIGGHGAAERMTVGQSAPTPGAPPGWLEAMEKDSLLGLDGRHRERIAGLEGRVRRYPAFPMRMRASAGPTNRWDGTFWHVDRRPTSMAG